LGPPVAQQRCHGRGEEVSTLALFDEEVPPISSLMDL
jgi:hypothetical protein